MSNPKMARFIAALVSGLLLVPVTVLAAAPVVSNVQVQQRPHSRLVDITFDLFEPDGDLVDIVLMASVDGGNTWPVRCDSLAGDVYRLESGPGKTITWTAEADLPDFQGENCRLRIFAREDLQGPAIGFFRITGNDTVPLSPGATDTVGFGQPLHIFWRGNAPVVEGMAAGMVASMDTVYPYADGLQGFKWLLPDDDCIPALEDCWHPRRYDEATGDSVSCFGSVCELLFQNNGSGMDPFHRLWPSGELPIRVNSIDIVQDEVPEYVQGLNVVVNYDPETILLNGETDWAHPEDPQVYPYYTMLGDPAGTRHPFVQGDRIPDRTYVVFKALARDDSRDMLLDPSQEIGLTGHFTGVRHNYTGGLFTFQSGASSIDYQPQWPAGLDGWAADTLGFLTGPSTGFTFAMQAVDEHGRRDGTPATISFEVGFPPCVQCVEILPGTDTPTGFPPDLDCYEEGTTHPCFGGGPAEFFIAGQDASMSPGREYLPSLGTTYLAIDKDTHEAGFTETQPDPGQYFSFQCDVYHLTVLLHGQDDPREAWSDPLLRSLAWRYQVDYDCDPYNSIHDGGGIDDILRPTWGHEFGAEGIEIDPVDGLWKLTVDVAVPAQLVTLGSATFLQIIQFTMAEGDPVLARELFDLTVRQIGDGMVRAAVLDQTRCDLSPVRPARYHIFEDVRPPVAGLQSGTWRDCLPQFPGIVMSLDLFWGAMESHSPGNEVQQHFRIVLDEASGDFTCDPDSFKDRVSQRSWHETE